MSPSNHRVFFWIPLTRTGCLAAPLLWLFLFRHLCCNVAEALSRPCLRARRLGLISFEWSVGVSCWSTGLLPHDTCDSVAFAVVPRKSIAAIWEDKPRNEWYSQYIHEIWIWENTSYWITVCCAGKSWNQIQTIFVFTVSVKLLNPPSVYIYLCMKIVNNKMWWTIFTITTSGNRTTNRIQMKQSNYILLTMTLLLLTYVTNYFYTWSYQTSYSRHYIYIYKYIYTLWFQRMYLTCSRATRIYQDLLAYIVYNRVFCRYVRAMLPVCSSTNASIVVRIFPV